MVEKANQERVADGQQTARLRKPIHPEPRWYSKSRKPANAQWLSTAQPLTTQNRSLWQRHHGRNGPSGSRDESSGRPYNRARTQYLNESAFVHAFTSGTAHPPCLLPGDGRPQVVHFNHGHGNGSIVVDQGVFSLRGWRNAIPGFLLAVWAPAHHGVRLFSASVWNAN